MINIKTKLRSTEMNIEQDGYKFRVSDVCDISEPNPMWNPFGKSRFAQYIEYTLHYRLYQEKTITFTKVILLSSTKFEYIKDKELMPTDELIKDINAFKRVIKMINQGEIPKGIL